MADDKRERQERRRIQRGGRRETDLRALTPELQAEAAEYAAEIARCLDVLNGALEDGDLVSARKASKTMKHAADALHLLLATGKAMR
jgi:hemolysin activation/secretion protein